MVTMHSGKKLVVYFDGTWNSADQHARDGKPCPTNVVKLFEATLPVDGQGIPQIVHYVKGIGTRFTERISGGGFGYGISDNIKDGYTFLLSNYEPGDHIYIIGFSRGAYTARSLAGMIRNVGILKREKLSLVNEAYDRYKDTSTSWSPRGQYAVQFRQEHTWGNETIRFLGVFDTVGALGAPFGVVLGWIVNKIFKCSFHDTQISSIIESAYHALSIDERRLPFMPTLMDPNTRHNFSNFEQKWFPGVHSNVGGGYTNSGLSDLALTWMKDKAAQQGLNLDLNKVRTQEVHPDVTETPNNSQTILYRVLTVATVKIPGYLGLIPKRYKAARPYITWKGDYLRPVPNVGNVMDFVGHPPAISDMAQYKGDLHMCTIDKINRCWDAYLPPNVCEED